MAVLAPLQNGQNIDADREMAWIKNGNYGTPHVPMAQDGAEVDNTLDSGKTTARWRKTYTNGIVSGKSSTAPALKWDRIALGPKNLISGLTQNGRTKMFTIDLNANSILAAGQTFESVGNFALILIPDSASGTPTIFNFDALAMKCNAALSNGDINQYSPFEVHPVVSGASITSVDIWRWIFYAGPYLAGEYTYFNDNARSGEWDGTTNNRGWLQFSYTTTPA